MATPNCRYGEVLDALERSIGHAGSELVFKNNFQLIVAVMLSAQCTDKRVNTVTPALFERFPDPQTMALSSKEEIFSYIRSVSYPNSKSTHLIAMARMVVEQFGGDIPSSTEDLQKLPGVGRKTANVVASIAFGAPVIAVDTHIFRVSHRTGLSDGKDPLSVEKDLTALVPADKRPNAHHWLLLHGRYVCTARMPKCDQCVISSLCPSCQSSNSSCRGSSNKA